MKEETPLKGEKIPKYVLIYCDEIYRARDTFDEVIEPLTHGPWMMDHVKILKTTELSPEEKAKLRKLKKR